MRLRPLRPPPVRTPPVSHTAGQPTAGQPTAGLHAAGQPTAGHPTAGRHTAGRPASGLAPVVGAVLLVGMVLLAGCGGGHAGDAVGAGTSTATAGSGTASSTSTTEAGRARGAAAGGPDTPPAVPGQGAYLGAWLHPTPATTGQSAFAVQQATVASVLAATGRPLGLLHVYAAVGRPAPVAELRAVVGDGSVPILDWGCGPDVATLASRRGRRRHHRLRRGAEGVPGPVFLRWCWEMNLVGLQAQIGGPAAFVGAWDHIRSLFRHTGASNVSFVWCPGLTGVDPAPYFPGASEVDWIGVDGYSHTSGTTFGSLFGAFVRTWQGTGRPLMVAKTQDDGDDQPSFIESIGADAPLVTTVKAVVYFDAPGPAHAWQFTPAGLLAFGRLASNPYFRPT